MSEPYLRKATVDDMELLYRLKNDETTRNNAFNTQEITPDEHKRWFSNKLNSDDTVIYIYCIDELPIGQIRVDVFENNRGLISYSIDTTHRKRGHGTNVLQLLETVIKNDFPSLNTLVGKVLKQNTASQKTFLKLNYRCTERDDHFEYEKTIYPY